VKAFVVAGTASGVGKTTVALAIIAALRSRHLTVQPFKCGPDFIDGGHLALVANRAARNLVQPAEIGDVVGQRHVFVTRPNP